MSTETPTAEPVTPAIDAEAVCSRSGEPTWEIARLFPRQGRWTETGYLNLETNQLVEFVRGHLEFLPVPTRLHQRLMLFILELLADVARRTGVGEALPSPLRVRTVDDVIREPDVVLLPPDDGSDPTALVERMLLAVEVTSPGKRNRARDYEEKRDEYALAKVPEYWIVDDESRRVTVYVLDRDAYRVHGEFTEGTTATSVLVPEFAVAVTTLFEAGRASGK